MRPRPQCDTVKWQESVAGEPLVQGIYHLKPSDPLCLWEGGREIEGGGDLDREWEAGRGGESYQRAQKAGWRERVEIDGDEKQDKREGAEKTCFNVSQKETEAGGEEKEHRREMAGFKKARLSPPSPDRLKWLVPV